MSIGTIASIKELTPAAYQPLLLAEIVWPDGTSLFLSSSMLSGTQDGGGGFPYSGHDYLPRLLNTDVSATQALSEQGIDFTPSVSLSIADPDRAIFNTYELLKGFKGAIMTIRFIFWSADTNNFSSDSVIKFVGTCQQGDCPDERTLRVTAVSKMNMVNTQLPPIRIQQTCDWNFPITAAQRQDGADNDDSPYFECGYSPDASGANAVGNMSGGTPYTSCNRTRADCMLRQGNSALVNIAPDGDITHDQTGRATGRFGGVQWMPPGSTVSRGYISGNWEEIVNNSNQVKYGDLIPFAYGTTWINAEVLNVTGDSNYTKMECLLCYGKIPYVYNVIVNGIRIPHANDGLLSGVPNELSGNNIAGGFWVAVNDGGRNGHLNADSLYDKKGDPYGSLAVIEIVVPKQVASASSTPQVQVMFDGPAVRVYSTPTSYVKQFTDNPAWVMLDTLIWAGWRATDVDIASFIAAANLYSTQIQFINQAGVSGNTLPPIRPQPGTPIPYAMYAVSLGLRQRTSAADILRGLRNNCKSLLVPNYDTGKLYLSAKQTLASQQPSPALLNGSIATNYLTPVSSVKIDGSAGTGYVAYAFDESNIAKMPNSDESTLHILPRSLADSPNEVSFQFSDAENQYNPDSLTVIETEDIGRVSGQPIGGSFPIQGINTWDRGQRATATWLAENLRGNPRVSATGETIGDTGGTIAIEFETSFRAIHLKIGDIIMVTYQQLNFIGYLFRITSVQPGMNAARIRIQANWHNDAWYLTSFGQANAPLYRHPQGLVRVPFSWCPNAQRPVVGDSMYPQSALTFKLTNLYSTAKDGTALVNASVAGTIPVTRTPSSPTPPLVVLQATSAVAGGSASVPGGRTYYIGVVSKDQVGSGYNPTFLANPLAIVAVPAGSNQNTITVTIQKWDTTSAGWVVFAGTSPQKLSYQADGSGTPSTITLSSYNEDSWGAPDQYAGSVLVEPFLVYHGGPAAAAVLTCTSTTIKLGVLTNAGFGINQFAGYDVTLYGMVNATIPSVPSQTALPVFNARIASNTADTLTLAAGLDGNVPDPTAIDRGDGTFGLVTFDVMVIRSVPTVGSDSIGNYLEDLNWINNLNPLFTAINVTACTNANPGVITTATNHGYSTGDLVYIQTMNGMTGFPYLATITVLSPTTFSIGLNTTSLGTYLGGGMVAKMDQGLVSTSEAGRMIYFIGTGTAAGTSAIVSSATQTRLYIQGNWPVVPDSTSRYVVISPSPISAGTLSNPITNPSYQQQTTINVPVQNYANQSVMLRASIVDGDGNESLTFNAPTRDFFVLGLNPGVVTKTVTGNYNITSDDEVIYCDTTNGSFTVTLLPSSTVPGQSWIIIKITSDANTATVNVSGGGDILTIAGVASSVILTTQGDSSEVVSNG